MARSTTLSDRRRRLLAAAALIAAGGGGFGVARLLGPPPAAPAEAGPGRPEAHPQGGGEGHVAMDAGRIQAAGVQVALAATGALAAEITLRGEVTPRPDGEAVLAARADGVVARIDRRLGDAVRAGETIALVESREASAIAADRASAAARAVAARQAYERERRLFEAGVSPRQDLEAAQAARVQAEAEVRRADAASAAARVSADGRSLAVASPIGGRLTAAPAVLGAYVTAGTELFRVADAGRVEVRAAAPAADAGRIAPGDPATVEAGDGESAAVVRAITPAVAAQSRAATVVLTLTTIRGALRPGQAVRVRVAPRAAGPASGRVVVPEEAVQSVEGRDVVFVRTAGGFRATPVVVGARGGGRAEILSGLAGGQVVAGRGAFLLKAELGKGEAHDAH